jgi:ribosomal protein S18 acetylase RimI-like enzyme
MLHLVSGKILMGDATAMYTIRTIDPTELPDVVGLFSQAVTCMQKKGIDQWDDQYPDAQTLITDLASGNAYGLYEERGLTGYIVLNEIQPEEYHSVDWTTSGRILVIHRLCINPTFQGEGRAKFMIGFAEEHARANGYSAIRLDAFPPNTRALALYENTRYSYAGTVHFRKGMFFCYEKTLRKPD